LFSRSIIMFFIFFLNHFSPNSYEEGKKYVSLYVK
jgi:hypothetical protein